MTEMIKCACCGKPTDPALENCPHCGGTNKGDAAQAFVPPPSSSATNCPNCASPVAEEDIICVRCGTNLFTGDKIAEEQRQEKKKRVRLNLMPALAVGGALLLMALLVGLIFILLTRDPLADAARIAREGNVLGAINRLKPYAETHPDNARAQKLHGRLLWMNEQWLRAADAFETALHVAPEDKEAALFAAVALQQAGGPESLRRQVSVLERMAEAHPGDKQALYLLALARGANQDYAGQIEALERLLALGTPPPQASTLVGVAQVLSGDRESAAATLEEALNSPASASLASVALGFLRHMQGDPAQATDRLQRAIEAGTPIDDYARTRLGLLYLAEGQVEPAIPLLSEAKRSGDSVPEAGYFYALCLQSAALDTEAQKEFEGIAAGRGPYAADAAVQLAMTYVEEGNILRANEFIARANDLGHESAKLHTVKGRLQILQEEPNEAQQSFRMAIQTDASYAPPYLEMGLLYIGRGVLTEGLGQLRRYLELARDDTPERTLKEIELLVEQLRQTLEQPPRADEEGSALAGSRT